MKSPALSSNIRVSIFGDEPALFDGLNKYAGIFLTFVLIVKRIPSTPDPTFANTPFPEERSLHSIE